jgi:endonuclease/exonuclease/phosphatase family metal-dependent hydrolase
LFSGDAGPSILANARLRALQAEAIAGAAALNSEPVVIAGDTNLPDLSPVFSRHLSRFQDGFVKAGAGFGYTYPNDRRPWMRIDRILATDALRFVKFEVGTSAASDHLCVVADLQRAR